LKENVTFRKIVRNRLKKTSMSELSTSYPHSNIKVLYRCDIDYFGIKERGGFIEEFHPEVEFQQIQVVSHTPRGFKVDWHGKSKFILAGNGKRFAHETKDWAYSSKVKRTRKRIEILKNQILLCESQLKILLKHEVG
jgi:hypothetical protein